MEKKIAAKTQKNEVTYSLGTIEIILFVVLCFALAFFLMGCAWLMSTGLCFCWETANVVIVIVISGAVIYFCIRALWWLFKRQRAKQEKSQAKTTSVVKRQPQPVAKKGK